MFMAYQSEAALEKNLLTKLASNGYERVTLSDEGEIEQNFRKQLISFPILMIK